MTTNQSTESLCIVRCAKRKKEKERKRSTKDSKRKRATNKLLWEEKTWMPQLVEFHVHLTPLALDTTYGSTYWGVSMGCIYWL